jgi:nitrite reductase/ring-hydroxylating ferredoxin subunit
MPDFLLVAPYSGILSHFRFLLTLRSEEGKYHSLILFRLATGPRAYEDDNAEKGDGIPETVTAEYDQLYAMEASCPHLGADLSHAEIEECEDTAIAVCPWHRYDFDLKTGKSDTGLKACTYKVEVRKDEADGVDKIWLETPDYGTQWRLVELRPVSEDFADPPPESKADESISLQNSATNHVQSVLIDDEPLVPLENPPKTLMQWAVLILNTPNPKLKVERTRHAVHLFRTAQLTSIGHKSSNAPKPPAVPPREDNWASNRVDKGMVKSKRNQASMLHALANIEQWA